MKRCRNRVRLRRPAGESSAPSARTLLNNQPKTRKCRKRPCAATLAMSLRWWHRKDVGRSTPPSGHALQRRGPRRTTRHDSEHGLGKLWQAIPVMAGNLLARKTSPPCVCSRSPKEGLRCEKQFLDGAGPLISCIIGIRSGKKQQLESSVTVPLSRPRPKHTAEPRCGRDASVSTSGKGTVGQTGLAAARRCEGHYLLLCQTRRFGYHLSQHLPCERTTGYCGGAGTAVYARVWRGKKRQSWGSLVKNDQAQKRSCHLRDDEPLG